MKQISNRLLAVKCLQSLFAGKGSLSTLLPALERDQPDANAPLIREYCYGVCRRYHRLVALAALIMDKPLRKKDADISCLILLGLYQLVYMRTPDHAAINETVSLTRQLKKPWARGLVNAVLRQAQRDGERLEAALDTDPVARYSHPRWLIDNLARDWPEDFPAILNGNNTQAPMTLRVNTCHTTRADYLARLAHAGLAARAGDLAPTAVVLDEPVDVAGLPGFPEALVSVQDEASQLAPLLLDPAPGQRVLDACAAPGGKTCALLEHAGGNLDLVALDNSEERLRRVHDNLARLGLAATVTCADAGAPDQWWDGRPFDAILLDAPCTGTGVIRRHPDIKLLRQASDLPDLAARQAGLLAALWPCLAPGGKLLYSTCSVLRDENARQLAAFLRDHADAAAVPIARPGAIPCDPGIQFFPVVQGNDGFYYGLLQKK